MFKPAKARYNSRWEELRQQFRRILRRDLTAQEERLLELSQSLLQEDQGEPPDTGDPASSNKQAS